MTEFTITREQAHLMAARLQPFMSKEVTRYYLGGVNLSREGGKIIAVATNGKILGKVELCPVESEGIESMNIIIPADMIGRLAKAKPGKGEDNDRVTFAMRAKNLWTASFGGADYHFTPIDGTYPQWQEVIPSADDTPEEVPFPSGVGFAVKLITDVCKAFGVANKDAFVRMAFNKDSEAPIRIHCKRQPEFMAVIMPGRD